MKLSIHLQAGTRELCIMHKSQSAEKLPLQNFCCVPLAFPDGQHSILSNANTFISHLFLLVLTAGDPVCLAVAGTISYRPLMNSLYTHVCTVCIPELGECDRDYSYTFTYVCVRMTLYA